MYTYGWVAEYGQDPRPDAPGSPANQTTACFSQTRIYVQTHGGTVSSSSRFQTVLLQMYSMHMPHACVYAYTKSTPLRLRLRLSLGLGMGIGITRTFMPGQVCAAFALPETCTTIIVGAPLSWTVEASAEHACAPNIWCKVDIAYAEIRYLPCGTFGNIKHMV